MLLQKNRCILYGGESMSLTEKQQLQEDGYSFPYHYLDLRSDEYRLLLHTEYVSRLQVIKDLLKPYQGQTVLDAGCGDGRLCYELRNEDLKLVGVDWSSRAITFARAFSPTVEFQICDLKYLDPSRLFDQVILSEVLEHFAPTDIPPIIQSLAKVLHPEGRLIVTVPSANMPLIPKHYQHFSIADLAKTLSDHFELEKCLGTSKIRNVSLLARLFYWRTKRVCSWLYPFRKHKWVTDLIEAYNRYYHRKLATGHPEECMGLVAIFKKKSPQNEYHPVI